MYTTGETYIFKYIICGISHVTNLSPSNICWKSRLAALESKNCVEDTNSKKRRRVHNPKIALLEARQSVLAEDEVGLWKCATIDLMSDEEDGIVDGVSGWIVRSQELTERHAAVEMRGDSKVQGNAPQTSAKWTEFRQNAASYLQLRSGKQTFHGAVGFWASPQRTINPMDNTAASIYCESHPSSTQSHWSGHLHTYPHTHIFK
ncbi:hypothetical protein DPX16_6987 [Anabarilius grahami]|uniref:Uncharacterized protein n=1 Tax=Anabarilius grahami TaxID=495550 RepID=A0A3N0Y604_ANAGA|nr:hypothetical protein DPX16_6987 [Anabarilius grahami]